MAISFPIPSAHSKSVITIDNFLGADFTNSPANVDDNKSPNLKNLIRDVPGKVRKCMGYETIKEYTDTPAYDEDFLGEFNGTANIIYHGVTYGTLTAQPEGFSIHWNSEKDALTDDEEFSVDIWFSHIGSLSSLNQEVWATISSDYNTNYLVLRTESGKDYGASVYYIISGGALTDIRLNIKFSKDTPDYNFSVYYNAKKYDTANKLPINGFHRLRKDDIGLVHAGEYMFSGDKVLYKDANNARSRSWEFDESIYIIDGKKLLRYGQEGNESDTKYSEDKTRNDVLVDDEVTFVIKRFSKPQNVLWLSAEYTDSPEGYFRISDDKRVITYTDKLTEVGQHVTFRCTYNYREKSSGSETVFSTASHHLVAIEEEKTYTVVPVETDAYTPLVTISKDPEGGGEPYEDLNLLNPAFIEQFLGKPGATEYNLSFTELDEVEPIVEVLNPDGEWEELTYGTDYTCDYEQGIITFVTAPGESPVTGEDNIKVTAYRTVDDYADRINKCTIGALFGVSGAMDRLFLSGNPDYINYDWYSAQYDPTYFADTSYSVLGSSGSAIVGYSIVSNYLAAHKDKYERDQNIILREGDLVESEPSFRIINTLQGAGAVAPFSFAYLATEPVFLTNQGVYAVTAQDVTGEKYAQNRSYFLDGKLLEEENLADAYGFVYNDMYWLCLNDVAYILDGLQPIQTDKSKPYATRQYVGFYRTNLPAYTMWENDGRLFFGTKDGKICRFFKDKYALESYNDDGEPIECIWETPDIIGKLFFKNKTLSHVAIKLDSAIAASVSIYVMNRGIWEFVRTDHWRARIFQFSKEVFSKHTFSCDKTQKVIPKKLRVKKVDKFRLRLTNNELNESFALYDIGFEYTETSNYMR